MYHPRIPHFVRMLSLVIATSLVACGDNDSAETNEQPVSKIPDSENQIVLSSTPFSDIKLPTLFSNGFPVSHTKVSNIKPTENLAQRGLSSSNLETLTGDFESINTSSWDAELKHLNGPISGNFFTRLTINSNQQNRPQKLFLSFANSDKVVQLCGQCTAADMDITITGINPLNFDLSSGSLTLQVWGQNAADITANTIRLVSSQTFNWQNIEITGISTSRTEESINLNWLALGGNFDRYNLYWRVDDGEQQQKLALKNTSYSIPAQGGSFQIEIRGVNADGESARSQTILLNNQAPVFAATLFTTAEDTPLTGNISSFFSDPDGHTVNAVVMSTGTMANGSFSLAENGDFTYTPATNFFGADSVSIEIIDQFGATSSGQIDFSVTPVNDVPVAQNDSFKLTNNESGVYVINYTDLLANDADADNDNLSILIEQFSTPEHATLNADNDQLSLTTEAGFIGQVTFSYQVADTQGLQSQAEVTVEIGDVGEALQAVNDILSVDEDTLLQSNLLLNDNIASTVPYTLSIVTPANHGSVILDQEGNLTYQPSANFNGTDSFTYQLQQSDGVSSATVSIDINAVDDAPLVMADSYSVNKGQLLQIAAPGVLANDIEFDGDPTTLAVKTIPAQGALTLNNDGSFDYQANDTFVGIDTFVYTLSDGVNEPIEGTVTIQINEVNLVPSVINGDFVTDEDISITLNLNNQATDPENETLVYSIQNQPINGTANISGAILTYQPNANYTGTDSLTFVASDGVNTSAAATIDLTINPVNDLPELTQTEFDVAEDASYNLDLLSISSDAEQDTLTFSIAKNPDFGQVTLTGSQLSYTPLENFSGVERIEITLDDGQGTPVTIEISLLVAVENDAPVITAQTFNTNEDAVLNINLNDFVTDEDGDTLSYSVFAFPLNGQFTLTNSDAIYTPNPEFSGTDKFQIQVSDGLATTSGEFIIQVNAVNDAPEAFAGNVTLNAGQSSIVDLSQYSTDIDSETLTYSVTTNPTQGTFLLEGSSLIYTPNQGFEGVDSLSFIANDGELNSAAAVIQFDVMSNVNNQFTPQAISYLPIEFNATDIKVNGDVLYLSHSTGVSLFDITDKKNVNHITTYTTNSPVKQIEVLANVLYLVLEGGVIVSLDVSQPLAITELSNLNLGGEISDVTFAGPYLLVTNELGGADFVYSEQGNDLTKAIRFNSVDKINTVSTNGDFLAFSTDNKILVIDTQNVVSPDLSNAAEYQISNVKKLYLNNNNTLYVACQLCGFKTFSVASSDSSEPPVIELISDSNHFFPSTFATTENFAVFNDSLFTNALPIVDISDTQNPVFSQIIDLSVFSTQRPIALDVDAQYVYATGQNTIYIAQYRQTSEPANNVSDRVSLDYFAFLNPQVTENAVFQVEANYQFANDKNEYPIRVDFYIDEVLLGSDSKWPFQLTTTAPSTEFTIAAHYIFANQMSVNLTQTIAPLPDSDSDGLSDLIETAQYNSNINSIDSDGDTLNDKLEAIIFTNLNLTDSDNDSVDDANEFNNNQDPINPDRTAPQVESQSPAADASDVCEYENVEIHFNEPLNNRLFNASNIILTQGESVIPSTVTANANHTAIILNPAQNLQSETTYFVTVQPVYDLAGNASQTFNFSFSTTTCTESIRPSVESFSPTANSDNIATNTQIAVKFNEKIDPASVNSDNVYLLDLTTSERISGQIILNSNNDGLLFAPNEALKAGRNHRLYTTALITDLFGNFLFPNSVTFTTGYQSDTTAPEVLTFSVPDNYQLISPSAPLAVKFSEAINPEKISGIELTLAGETVPSTLSFDDNKQRVIIQPTNVLQSGQTYQIRVSDIADLSGNLLTSSQSLSFTTSAEEVSQEAKLIAWSLHSNGQQNLPLNTKLSVLFDQAIDVSSINESSVYLYDSTGTRTVNSSVTWSADQKALHIEPHEALKPQRTYRLYISYTAPLYAISGIATDRFLVRSFTTTTTTDQSAPTISVHTLQEENLLAVNSQLSVQFDESVNPFCEGASLNLIDDNETPVAHSWSLDSDSRVIHIVPDSNLNTDSSYKVVINNLCDHAGNQLTANTLVFTTGSSSAEDTSAPNLIDMDPPHQSSNANLDTPITLTFDEPISPLSSIKVTGAAGVTVAGSTEFSGNTLVFTPSVPLQGDTRYNVAMNFRIYDLAGNNKSLSTRYFNTLQQIDQDKPVVVFSSPANGQSDVSPQQQVKLEFNEPLNKSTITNDNFALFHNGERLSTTIYHSDDNMTVTLESHLPQTALVSLVVTDDVTDISGNTLDPFIASFTTGLNKNEIIRPQIKRMSPELTLYSNQALNTLYLYASEPLDENSLTNNLFVTQDGVLLNTTSELIANGYVIKVSNTTNFAENSLIEVRLTSDVTDVNDNPLFAYQNSFFVNNASEQSGISPFIVDVSFNNFATLTQTNPVFRLKFSEPLNAETITDDNINLKNSFSGTNIPVDVELSASEDIIIVTPAIELSAEQNYILQLSTNIEDSDGDAIAFTISRFFSLSENAIFDDRTPELLLFSPPEVAQEVSIQPNVAMQFDEAIDLLSIDYQQQEITDVEISGDKKTIRYRVSQPFAPKQTINYNLPRVADFSGNLTANKVVDFTTGETPDFIAPTLTETSFAQNEIISRNATFYWQFNEAIDPTSMTSENVYLWDYVTNAKVASALEISNDLKTVKIIPTQALAAGRRYVYYAYGLRDLSGNSISYSSVSVKTNFEEDTNAPFVTATTLQDGATNVPVNLKFNVRFNEKVRLTEQSIIRLEDSAGNQIAINSTLTREQNLLSVVPQQLLSASTEYTLTVENVSDTYGNIQQETLLISFTTGTRADLAGGQVEIWGFDSANTQDLAINPVIGLEFSEAIDPATIDSDSLYLWESTRARATALQYNILADQQTILLTPENTLPEYSSFAVYLSYAPYITDLAGNRINALVRYFTTGNELDETPATIINTSFANAANEMPLNTQISIEFDERIARACELECIKIIDSNNNTVEFAGEISSDKKTITLIPQNLQPAQSYTIIADGLFDYSGNALNTEIVNFTTSSQSTIDDVAPSFVEMMPAHQSTDVALDMSQIILTFDENIAQTSRITISANGADVDGSQSVNGNQLIFNPATPLSPNTRHTVRLYNEISDYAGNYKNLSTKYFDTADITDNTSPTIVSVLPTNGSTAVSVKQPIEIAFSEPMNSNTLNSNNIAVFENGVKQSVSISRSVDNKRVLINAGNLAENAVIEIALHNSITDISGNTITDFVSSFTTAENQYETSKPYVISRYPANAEALNEAPEKLVIYFSEKLSAQSLPASFEIAVNGQPVSIQSQLDPSQHAILITLPDNLAAPARIDYALPDTLTDLAGNYAYDTEGYFTLNDLDNTNLFIKGHFPNHNSISLNSKIDILFSHPLDQSTVNTSSIIMTDTTANPDVNIPITVALNANNPALVTVTPDTILSPNTQYRINLSTELAANNGNTFTSQRIISLQTSDESTIDQEVPTIVAFNPSSDLNNIGINPQFALKFSETVNPLRFTPAGVNQASILTTEQNTIFYYTLKEPLTTLQQHTFILNDLIYDDAGNVAADHAFSFATGETIDFNGPILLDASIVNNQMNIATNLTAEFLYNEAIDPVSIEADRVYIYNHASGENVSSNIQLSENNRRITITPNDLLEAGTQHTIYLTGLRDTSGNSASATSRTMVTGFSEDNDKPTVINTNILNGQQNVPLNPVINIKLDESISPITLDMVQLVDNENKTIAVSVDYLHNRQQIALSPAELLQPQTTYQLTIAEITDNSGNTLSNAINISFTSSNTVDLTIPNDIEWNFNANQQEVATDFTPTVTFDEMLDTTSINNESFYLLDNNNNLVAATLTVNTQRDTITLVPDNALELNTTYTLYVGYNPYLYDLSANRANSTFRRFTTTDN
ncbi:Ig-like domain-containing protein [Catenovulum sediminis]|uniref:Ig-like domain-containing protein n=1 Tax=Catenovulum sediminis TaxID=1740262 RepID=A0ABV1RGR8_9ALTE